MINKKWEQEWQMLSTNERIAIVTYKLMLSVVDSNNERQMVSVDSKHERKCYQQ